MAPARRPRLTLRSSFAVAVLKAYVTRKRAAERLVELVLLDFDLDPTAASRKGDVHASLAQRLGRPISNALVVELQEAFRLLEAGVVPITRSGRGHYLGLKARPSRRPTPMPNVGRKHSAEHVEKNRRAALEREARRREARRSP